MLTINPRVRIPLTEFSFTFVRSSGPGGQNVNKVASKAVLRWDVVSSPSLPEDVRQRFVQQYARRISGQGELVLSSQRYRDQGRNVADCLERLRTMLTAVAAPPKPRKATRPTAASRRRRLQEKRRMSEKKSRRRPPPAEG
jgi:ribosome-associated protein